MRRLLLAFFAVAVGAGAACKSTYTSDDPTPSNTSDAGVVSDASVSDAAQEASSAVVGCADRIIYVATGGDDVNTGCDPHLPKETIKGAIDYAKTLGVTNHEIHVCSDTYPENGLVLDYPVTLRGGYECSSFTRAASFGWGGFNQTTGHGTLDSTNETIIQAGEGVSALDVGGPSVTNAIAIEGFTMQGRDADGGAGLTVHDGAAPVVSQNHIIGASAGAFSTLSGSAGVNIMTNATPEVTHNIIVGGGGGNAPPFSGAGSEGVLVQTPTSAGQPEPHIHDNEIDSGSGTSSDVSAVGIDLYQSVVMTDANAVSGNAIFHGGSIAGAGFASIGIWVRGAAANLVGNGVYDVGNTCGATSDCVDVGIFLNGSGTTVVGNRIELFGSSTAAAIPPNVFGAYVQVAVSDVLIANNLFEVGRGNWTGAAAVEISYGADTVHVEANTMFGTTNVTADGIQTVGNNVTIDDNLMVGLRYGISSVAAECTIASPPAQAEYPPVAINNNVFAGMTAVASLLSATGANPACGANAPTTYAKITPFQAASPQATANLVLSSTCVTGDASCLSCAASTCFQEVFATSPVTTTVFTGKATLAPAVSCAIATGGAVTSVTTDLAGAKRTAPASVGALEDDGACTSP